MNQNENIIIKRGESGQGNQKLDVKLQRIKEDRNYFSQEQLGIDKIVEDSGSNFYITGKTLRISFIDLLNLLDKHDINAIENIEQEEVVISSRLVTQIATAEVIDEDEDKLKLFDATAVGLFMAGLVLGLFAVFSKSLTDIKTFAWIITVISGLFLLHYLYRGMRTGEINRITKAWMRKAGK